MDKENVLYLHSQAESLIKNYQQQYPSIEEKLRENVVELSMKQCPYGIDKQTIIEKLQKFNVVYKPQEKSSYQNVKHLIKSIDHAIEQMIRTQQLIHAYPEWSKPFIDKYNDYINTTIKKSSFIKKDKSKGKKTHEKGHVNSDGLTIVDETEDMNIGRQLYQEFYDFIHTIFKPKELEFILKELIIEVPLDVNIDVDDSKEWTGIVYNDNNRINFNVKYKYEKKCHFRDTLNQFQGLQNKVIPNKVVEDLKDTIEKHGLSNEHESDLQKRYARVDIEHIRLFLTETGHNKYYEDLQLIYSKITSKKCPDISRFEKQLYDDFDELVEAFLSLPDTNRKNFLNVHYVLRQLLKRRGYKVSENGLSHLKTPSRMREHDDIYQKCCEKLQWNFTPLY